MITSINDFRKKNETKEMDTNMSDDILMFKPDTLAPIDPEVWAIDHIVDIIRDPTDIAKYDKIQKESNGYITTDLTYKGTGVGETIWITAMLKPRNNSTAYPMGELGVLQCKILQTYYGLTKLNQLKNSGKI